MRCSKCGSDNREGRKFCVHCGQALKLACPSCGAPSEPGERFCGDCGAALVVSTRTGVDQSPTAPSNASDIRIAAEQADTSLDGERKTVTALFADIKGSTELMRNLDPEEARAIVDPVLHTTCPTHGFLNCACKEGRHRHAERAWFEAAGKPTVMNRSPARHKRMRRAET